jgi:hypothetical protein
MATQYCMDYIQCIGIALAKGHPEIIDLYTGFYHSSLARVTDHRTRKQIEKAFAQLYERRKER